MRKGIPDAGSPKPMRARVSGQPCRCFESLRCVVIFWLSTGIIRTMNVVLIFLSSVGLYISLYFSLVYYTLIGTNSRFVPAFCRMEEGTCQLVVHHVDARALGVPNSLLGVGYYILLILLGAGMNPPLFVSLMRFASWISVVLAAWLVHSLLFRIKLMCLLCLVSHGLNLVIAVLLTLYW